MVDLSPEAFALRPIRIVGQELRVYEATTFPKNPWTGCELWLRRLKATGSLGGDYALIDVLNENGDIVQDFGVSKRGFAYLRRKLRFKIERG